MTKQPWLIATDATVSKPHRRRAILATTTLGKDSRAATSNEDWEKSLVPGGFDPICKLGKFGKSSRTVRR